ALLMIHYDNGTEIYLNGKELWKATGWNDDYAPSDVTATLRAALEKGKNVIAVHTHQDTGGQFIDLGIYLGHR
ncbi:hypothetical protein HYR69_03910, partial [Candidatus Sumerlaeota bacterium]|nr:hypothetical protein [Candidatus Sumerlaeota bacterium]